jgi:hypothetical protein
MESSIFNWLILQKRTILKNDFLLGKAISIRMIPSEMSDPKIPLTVLRYLWSTKVLKAGLGVMNEQDVRKWFYENPDVLREFAVLNQEFQQKVEELQIQARNGLQALSRRSIAPFPSSKKRKSLNYSVEEMED